MKVTWKEWRRLKSRIYLLERSLDGQDPGWQMLGVTCADTLLCHRMQMKEAW